MTHTLDSLGTEQAIDPVMTRLAFDAAIDQLTQPAQVTVTRDDGTLENAATPCLLDQLVQATEPGTERSGTSAPGSRPPASLNALELVAQISQAMRTALAALGRDLFGTSRRERLAGQVRVWASYAEQWQFDDPDYLVFAAREAERWVAAGRAVLDPPPRFRLRGHACPTCGHTTVLVWSEIDDEWVRQPALGINTERVDVVCAACETRWSADTWERLGQVLRAQQRETLALDCE
ncbi:hypothetical protein [Amycolatopsis sp. NPDC059657]|uniref:DUF7341 domain-containing protein n=1 Tax=Amycolatopsis sp. NPDC059657 TaxID=3346899 RepID=UPI00366F5037